jgi:hypothetical protein
MSQIVKLTIPDELARRVEEKRGDQTMQEYILAALRSAVHGSPVEVELRRQLDTLTDIMRGYMESQAKPLAIIVPPVEQDKRKGW